MKITGIIIGSILLFLVSTAAFAGSQNEFKIPDSARRVSDGLYYLGHARDPQTQKEAEGYAFIHYKQGFQHRPSHAGGSGGSTTSSCYSFLARDAKWKSPENWIMNPSNTESLDETTIFSIMQNSINKWESSAVNNNIIGGGATTTDLLSADTNSMDGQNEVYFGAIEGNSAIGVTIVWGIFGGPPSGRQLLEWDQIYDDETFDWSAAELGVLNKMDFESIATHELGHTFGLGDLYQSDCQAETMYGYAGTGEINKRDLNAGDIAGIQKLY